MFGMINKMVAIEGRRDDLTKLLHDATRDMPGCLNYIVAQDAADTVTIWITEVWESVEHHTAGLTLPHVQEAIQAGRPSIASMETVATLG